MSSNDSTLECLPTPPTHHPMSMRCSLKRTIALCTVIDKIIVYFSLLSIFFSVCLLFVGFVVALLDNKPISLREPDDIVMGLKDTIFAYQISLYLVPYHFLVILFRTVSSYQIVAFTVEGNMPRFSVGLVRVTIRYDEKKRFCI